MLNAGLLQPKVKKPKVKPAKQSKHKGAKRKKGNGSSGPEGAGVLRQVLAGAVGVDVAADGRGAVHPLVVKRWSNDGQTLVESWSNAIQRVRNATRWPRQTI